MVAHSYGRAQIERWMTDTCTVVDVHEDEEGILNELTFAVSYDTETVVYSGKCSIQIEQGSRPARADGRNLEVSDIVVRLPAGTTGVKIGHRVRPGTVEDADLTGAEFVVTRVVAGSNDLAKELICEDVRSYPSTAGAPS